MAKYLEDIQHVSFSALIGQNSVAEWLIVTREESTPRYAQLEVSLPRIPLSYLAIELDISLIQELIVRSTP